MTRQFVILGLLGAALILWSKPTLAVTIETVPVGYLRNAPDTRDGDIGIGAPGVQNLGRVDYAYRIATTEVTIAQYAEFLNAKAQSDPYGLYNSFMSELSGGIVQSGVSGSFTYSVIPDTGNKPVAYISWSSAARFVNWINNGQGNADTETGAYTLTGSSHIPRNANATWFLPSLDEWYKAAYYDPRSAAEGGPPDNSHYWLYATMSNTAPTHAEANLIGDISNPGANVANYDATVMWGRTPVDGSGNVTTVGSAGPLSESFFGTSDQSGNVAEFTEGEYSSGSGRYVLRGGDFMGQFVQLRATNISGLVSPITGGRNTDGFRIATVPEPSSLVLAAVSLACLIVWRRRR